MTQAEDSMRTRRSPCASAAAHVPGIAGDSPALAGETGFRAIRPGIHGDRLYSENAEPALVDEVIAFNGPPSDEESRACRNLRDLDDSPITTALLLAAGAGTRLQPLTDGCPKCLTEVHGVPILGRLLSCLVEQGFKRLVVVVGYRGEQIRDYLESNAAGLAVHVVDCPEYATTNNVYSLWMARECIRESFVLIESDLLFDSRLLGLMRVRNRVAVARFQPRMIGTTVSIDESGRVVSFHVGADPDTPNLAQKTVNLYSLSAAAWREVVRRLERRITAGRVHDYYEVVFAEMVAEGLLFLQAVSFDVGRWCEVDTLEDLRVAEQLFYESRGDSWPRDDRALVFHRRKIVTAPLPCPESGQSKAGAAVRGSLQLDYSKVRAYWGHAQPSILGPYMMEGFGFPAGAGRFRFRGEQDVVEEAVKDLRSSISVLDFGSGVGVWTEYFAQRFANVVSVEASPTLYAALKERCSRYPNVVTFGDDVLSFEPKGRFGLVFLGGLLMYLNERDVRVLLSRLVPCLEPDALILCRESTIRHGSKTLQGDYQVVYRSVETYQSIFGAAGFDVVSVEANAAYINVQMSCELIRKWKALVPERFWCLPVVGHLVYWGLRLGYPWNTRLIPWLLGGLGREFPSLTNHFFVLRPSLQVAAERRDTSSHGTQFVEEMFENAR